MMLAGIDPGWLWMIGGVLAVAAEILVPGVFIIWFGIAAVLTTFTLIAALLRFRRHDRLTRSR